MALTKVTQHSLGNSAVTTAKLNLTTLSTGNTVITGTANVTGAATFSNTVAIGSDYISPYAGFKNRVINGDFRIWQRGTSGTSHATSAYGPDRWRNYGGNALTLTSSTSYGSPQSLLIQASNTNHGIGQRIEAANIADLAGQTVTISYKVRADNPGTHNFLMYYANAVDNWSGETNFVNTAKSYTSNIVTTITHTVTLPAQAANGISIVFQWYNGGSSINITAFIWDVQLEVGSTATSFERRPYGHELQLCQRYCEVVRKNTNETLIGIGFNYTNQYVFMNYPFKVTKRTEPTGTLTGSVGDLQYLETNAGWGSMTSASFNTNLNTTRFNMNIAPTTKTAGQANEIRIEAGSSTKIVFDAEL